jgi:hypothetical protein
MKTTTLTTLIILSLTSCQNIDNDDKLVENFLNKLDSIEVESTAHVSKTKSEVNKDIVVEEVKKPAKKSKEEEQSSSVKSSGVKTSGVK